uniref:Uncharacterized protein n=1 Tax=Rhizophora mucronata TaxID=61149 RepID=A0A2P2MKU2_RHIMU
MPNCSYCQENSLHFATISFPIASWISVGGTHFFQHIYFKIFIIYNFTLKSSKTQLPSLNKGIFSFSSANAIFPIPPIPIIEITVISILEFSNKSCLIASLSASLPTTISRAKECVCSLFLTVTKGSTGRC